MIVLILLMVGIMIFNDKSEKEKILQYWYLKDLRLTDDVATYENRYKVRKTDEVDHLESIIAITRQKMFNEVMLEISQILELGPYDKAYLKQKIGALNELL